MKLNVNARQNALSVFVGFGSQPLWSFSFLSRAFCESTFIRLLFVGLASRPRRFLLLLRVWRVNGLFCFCFLWTDESAAVFFFLISWVLRVSLCDFSFLWLSPNNRRHKMAPYIWTAQKGAAMQREETGVCSAALCCFTTMSARHLCVLSQRSLLSTFVSSHREVCSAPLCCLTKKSAQHLCVVSQISLLSTFVLVSQRSLLSTFLSLVLQLTYNQVILYNQRKYYYY